MKKLTILFALVLAPLVGTVALSDFNYLGQGGGGLSESDVQTLIDASIASDVPTLIASAAYTPAFSAGQACDPEEAEPGPTYCKGGLVTSAYLAVELYDTVGDLNGARLSPQDIKQLPWNSSSTGPWTFELCDIGAVGGVANCAPGIAGVHGVGGSGTGVGAELADINSIFVPVACADVGPPFLIAVVATDAWGNWVVGSSIFVNVTDDVAGACGP